MPVATGDGSEGSLDLAGKSTCTHPTTPLDALCLTLHPYLCVLRGSLYASKWCHITD